MMSVFTTGKSLLDPSTLLPKAGLTWGMSYADLGAGSLGHFVLAGAHIVGPEGRVFAVDILKGALASIESLARLQSLTNIETSWGDIEKLGGTSIKTQSIDFVSLVNVTYLLSRKNDLLMEIHRILKPGGIFLAIDWVKETSALGPRLDKRMDPMEISTLLAREKFSTEKPFDAGPHHWGIVSFNPGSSTAKS